MIRISGMDIGSFNQSALTELEREIIRAKQQSPVVYSYDSPEALLFELHMRSRIVDAARSMNASGVSFATFDTDRANEQYWSRTPNGGFRQNPGVLASDAINDIFANGRLYSFECATAMVIILYKATMESIGYDTFNAHFRNLLLYDWQYDDNLRLITVNGKNEAYPGDVLYFRNPDHDPDRPEWQGENAIMLAPDQFFGHGVGIRTHDGMIAALNKIRRPGSTTSAYLTDEVDHPDFEHLRRLERPIAARIGMRSYLYRCF